MVRIVCILIGYFFGLFQSSYIYGKLHGINIKQHGSGNAGTTNTFRVMGKKAGAIVLICDIMKAGFAMLLVKILFGETHGDIMYLLTLYAAAGTILGHDFPFYLGFKGGKGIACTVGLVVFFHPYMFVPEAILFLGIFFSTHYVSLASLLGNIGLVVEMVLFGQLGVFGDLPQAILNEMYIITALIAALAFWGHRTNIDRLIHKSERKTYLTKKNEQ